MKRIDFISQLTQKCTGCMACVDICPVQCISSTTAEDGFRYSIVDASKCVSCGKCYEVCPAENYKKNNTETQKLFAAYAKDSVVQNNGSSGGVFELLANYFRAQSYYICAAAFDSLTLKHILVSPEGNIRPLLKSKYIQSDTRGIYKNISGLLQKGEKVFFCGTPCQVSALINFIPNSMRDNLFTADIICHGVPSQKIFDDYVLSLEKKHNGKVSDFSFRIKDNQYKHAHGFSYKVTKNGKTSVVNGIYTGSSYYNAFKKYLIFRNSCYSCQYATLQRTSDITLADFWGIEKYDFKGNVDTGVSMIITNTPKGYDAFSSVKEQTVSEEFPVQYGVDSNYCLTNSTVKPKNRDAVFEEIALNGYEFAAKKYFGSSLLQKAYWFIPPKMRNLIRIIRGS